MNFIACVAAAAASGLALTPGLSAASPAAAQTYAFINVADDAGPYSSFLPAPAINNAGTVAFFAFLDVGGYGIFTGPDPVADAVATTAGPYASFDFFSTPAINAAGTVAFRATRDAGGEGIFTGPDPVADAVVTSDGPYSSFGGAPAINDAGTVAFRATRDAGGDGIFTGPDPVADAVVTSDGLYANLFSNPVINNSGEVAFFALLDFAFLGREGVYGIFTGPDPAADAVATTDGPYLSFSAPTINDAGTVAFDASLDGGGEGIFTGPDPVADALVTSDGPYVGFAHNPPINDAGTVAFRASFDVPGPGRNGIFTGPDPAADKVIATGDALFGSTVLFLEYFSPGLNDHGDVAFYYLLNDWRTGIAVAAVVPEPAPVALIALGGLTLPLRRRAASALTTPYLTEMRAKERRKAITGRPLH